MESQESAVLPALCVASREVQNSLPGPWQLVDELNLVIGWKREVEEVIVHRHFVYAPDSNWLLRRVVIQVLSQPPFDLVNVHAFALAVVGNLITLNLAKTEVA